MNFTTAVLTAPRPASLLEQTLDSLEKGGWKRDEITVWDGTPTRGELPSANGCTQAYKKLFRRAGILRWEMPLLVFEDDIVVCRGLKECLEAAEWPDEFNDIAMVSPYCCTAYSNYFHGHDIPRWHREDHRTTLAGTQAFIYTPWAIRTFARELDPECHDGVDVQMGKLAQRNGKHVWYLLPSGVDHRGINNSAVGYGDLGTIYRAETFPGEDFDMRSLI